MCPINSCDGVTPFASVFTAGRGFLLKSPPWRGRQWSGAPDNTVVKKDVESLLQLLCCCFFNCMIDQMELKAIMSHNNT